MVNYSIKRKKFKKNVFRLNFLLFCFGFLIRKAAIRCSEKLPGSSKFDFKLCVVLGGWLCRSNNNKRTMSREGTNTF